MIVDRDPNWLLPMLAAIRTRPGRYLGAESIDALILFMFGYEQGRLHLGTCGMSVTDKAFLDEFGGWLARRAADPDGDNPEWAYHIYKLDRGSRNIHVFFSLFEEFLKAKERSLSLVHDWELLPEPGKVP